MKKFRFLLFIYFVGLTMGVNAYDFSVVNADGKTIYYNVISNTNLTCEVTYGTNKYSETVNVSASVSYNSKTYSVVEIGSEAFYYCSGLTSVEIPSSVTSIGSYAFKYCSGLTSITNLATTPQVITNYTFTIYGTLHVIKGYKDVYANADYWKKFTIVDDVDPAGIEEIRFNDNLNDNHNLNKDFYNLQGMKVDGEPYRGIVIKNGKKYVVK